MVYGSFRMCRDLTLLNQCKLLLLIHLIVAYFAPSFFFLLLKQLATKVTLFEKGIRNGSIIDDNNVLAASLQEIVELENSLLQANSDAMRIAARIISHLEKP